MTISNRKNTTLLQTKAIGIRDIQEKRNSVTVVIGYSLALCVFNSNVNKYSFICGGNRRETRLILPQVI